MSKPKKPKMVKKPRKPKTKTIAAMEKYLDRVKEVERENQTRTNQYKKDLRKWEELKKRVERA